MAGTGDNTEKRPKTIGNPLSWAVQGVASAGHYAADATASLGGEDRPIEIREITTDDIRFALRKGVDDFTAFRGDVVFAVLLYPVIGIALAYAAFNSALIPAIFPAAAGFTLIGPFAAVGLYEMSRRREAGESPSWFAAFSVIAHPRFAAILALGVFLILLLFAWVAAALYVYFVTLGPELPLTAGAFLGRIFTTTEGWAMLFLGCGIGFLFALLVLAVTVVSFPLLLDRRVGVVRAVVTSLRLTARNPRTVATWGLVVAVSLAIGSIPFFLGLIVVLPVLGHATWHLYRRAIG